MSTLEKPTVKDFPVDPATGEVTINLSKTETLTVQIPGAPSSPDSSVQLTVTAPSKPPKSVGPYESMLVKKTPETHPDNFEEPELRKGVTLTLRSDELKAFSSEEGVELRYTFTYASGWNPDTSEPQMLRIKA